MYVVVVFDEAELVREALSAVGAEVGPDVLVHGVDVVDEVGVEVEAALAVLALVVLDLLVDHVDVGAHLEQRDGDV